MNDSFSLADALRHPVADKRIEILRLIDVKGSISQAARQAGISYKAAWQAIDTLTNLAGVALVEKNVGGAGGGGATLTIAGRQLLEMAMRIEKKRMQLMEEFLHQDEKSYGSGLPLLGVQTSMRNQLPCLVKSVRMTGPITQVLLELRDKSVLSARITSTSAELLGLKPGLPVIALCKAVGVSVSREMPRSDVPPSNLLSGVVCRIASGTEEDELSIELVSGLQLVGFAPSELGVELQERVYALVEESTVVVALFP